jgi:hypothetical protein
MILGGTKMKLSAEQNHVAETEIDRAWVVREEEVVVGRRARRTLRGRGEVHGV